MAVFKSLLIANRGEIACRIARTAQRMGLRTIAVYSDADARARHVASCGEAVHIGAAPAEASYLRIEAILEAARRTGAEAIHPGYGFLSENAEFAVACARAGLIFVGPPPEAIRAMGSKAAAKTLLERAGVPLTPGYHGERQEPEWLEREADRIGFPVLIKASAGGGGKGMRRVDRREDFATALAACRRESAASFGDDRVLVEKYLLRPRHIEIQVFADAHGHCIHLFERDCSVQRRHQKVLEEAPAPGMTAERRAAMGTAAVAAARAVGYIGAGTVEFIVAPDGTFYFMEMNTRLQVEHPVTEMITGLDLVEWQLRVAGGERLPLAQEQLALRGHAIEARIYAEDPDRGFLPATGRLVHVSLPAASPRVRIDTGVRQGDEITPYYDPLIAKLIVWGETRNQALAQLGLALAQYRIAGVANNLAFLARLIACPAFVSADLDTTLIERSGAQLFPGTQAVPDEVWLVVAASELVRQQSRPFAAGDATGNPSTPWTTLDGWRLNEYAQRHLTLRHGETERTMSVRYLRDAWDLQLADRVARASGSAIATDTFDIDLDGKRHHALVVAVGAQRHVFLRDLAFVLTIVDPLVTSGATAESDIGLRAPMPGRVVALLAMPGAALAAGAPLLVLEAMKMEHTITAPSAGQLRAFKVAAGDQVGEGEELVDFLGADGRRHG
ncbi:MAG: biotin carboxylase N-terminal domain-containing protein [Steroidobacteraceae bacterium]